MAIFISHVTLTQEGVKAIKDVTERIEESKKIWEEAGGRLLEWYMVLGDYDYLLITEAPDEKVMAEIVAKASRRGRTQFRTYMGIPIEEFAQVTQRL